MRRASFLSAVAVFGMLVVATVGQDLAQNRPPNSSIQVSLPAGNIEIAYVESNEGMILVATCKRVTVRSQRMYLGDGENAVLFEANTSGLVTPNGTVNASAIELKSGETITISPSQREVWGATRGALYVRTESLKFVVSKNE